jgi:hypothetical protein
VENGGGGEERDGGRPEGEGGGGGGLPTWLPPMAVWMRPIGGAVAPISSVSLRAKYKQVAENDLKRLSGASDALDVA